jgi:3-deoxy-D-arabino-heptulosonate 7-phosphate (DAHP) synthase
MQNKNDSLYIFGPCSLESFEQIAPVAAMLRRHGLVYLRTTVDEWLEAARYLIQGGVPKEKIVLCERGTRSVTSPTGVQLDFIAALEAKKHGFKVIIDPSHGSKRSEFVIPLARASLHLGLDGLMVECHPRPAESVSDAKQAISLEVTEDFIKTSLQ